MTDIPADRFDDIDARLDALGEEIAQIRTIVTSNSEAIAELRHATSELLDIARIHQQALRIAQQDAAEFRAEIRRIWEYLLRERPNGHGAEG